MSRIRTNTAIFISITALGVSSVMTQLSVMREVVSVVSGNELTMGILLACWLFHTGIGAYLGRFSGKHARLLLIIFQLAVAILPLLHVVAIRVGRNVVFLRGELIGVSQIFWSVFLLLMPYCLISGYLLTLACSLFISENPALSIGEVYFLDNIGDIVGGVLFSFILVHFLNTLPILYVPTALNLLAATFLAIYFRQKLLTILTIVSTIFVAWFLVSVDLELITLKALHPKEKILHYEDSLYGKLLVTDYWGQMTFYENNQPLFTTDETIANEETVHFAMVQHREPRNVLLIGGGVSGTLQEIAKYAPQRIDYVELDPAIIRLARKFVKTIELPQINIITDDGRHFVKQTATVYDVVIVDLPDPDSAQLNRFYSVEFFRETKRILSDGGILSLSLSGSANYMGQEMQQMSSVLYHTLRKVFKETIIIPGEENYYLSSDRKLSFRIGELIEQRGIATKYVNQNYLLGTLTPERIEKVMTAVTESAPTNSDFQPIFYYYYLRYWLSQFESHFLVLGILGGLGFLVYVLSLKTVPFAIFTTGFTASGLEVALLIAFQITSGYLYYEVGIIITLFMVGLAIGAFMVNKGAVPMNFLLLLRIELGLISICVILPVVLYAMIGSSTTWLPHIFFPLASMVTAVMVGMEFPLCSNLDFKGVSKTAGQLYSADLLGACLGAILVSVFLIPLIGILWVCWLFGAINVVSIGRLWLWRQL